MIGLWSLKISRWTVTLFPEAEIFAEASFEKKKDDEEEEEEEKEEENRRSFLENI